MSIAEQLGIPATGTAASATSPCGRSSSWPPAAASATPTTPPPPRRRTPPTRPSSSAVRPSRPPGRAAAGRPLAEAARVELAQRQAAWRLPRGAGTPGRRGRGRAAEAASAPAETSAAPAAAPSGSYQEYALGQLGGNGSEFSCLENLWGKESGWNPNAQNPTSTAYGIAQFLDSTWAGTGIAKTSDGYRQIDAGLIYIENRYGTPCGAWAHSQANDWY